VCRNSSSRRHAQPACYKIKLTARGACLLQIKPTARGACLLQIGHHQPLAANSFGRYNSKIGSFRDFFARSSAILRTLFG
jgi:hypothetical protein